jgi:hypothetical protein
LQETGYQVLVVDAPVPQSEIQGEHLRQSMHREWCCDEFIQLYAYDLLSEDIVVHVDLDLAFYKPLDDLFDAILFDQNSQSGIAARRNIHQERHELDMPDQIDAFWTKDWTQVAPEKWPAGYQTGFIVARRDPAVLKEMLEVIREGNYTDGMPGKVVGSNCCCRRRRRCPCFGPRAHDYTHIPYRDVARRLCRILLRQDSARYRGGVEPVSVQPQGHGRAGSPPSQRSYEPAAGRGRLSQWLGAM